MTTRLIVVALLLFVGILPLYAQSQRADSLLAEAEKLLFRNQYPEAAEVFVAASKAEQLSAEPRISVLSKAFFGAGYSYHQAHRYEEALYFYEQALGIVEHEFDSAAVLNAIGMVYLDLIRPDQAISYLKRALEINRRSNLPGGVARIAAANNLSNMGEAYRVGGRFADAIASFEQALKVFREFEREVEVAPVLNNIGAVYLSWARFEEAIYYFEQALEINRRPDRPAEIARDLNNIGVVYQHWQRYDEAINYFKQALEINRKLTRPADIAANLNNIGKVYQADRRFEEANDYFEQALEINRDLERWAEMGIQLENIGAIYQHQDRFAEALDHYKKALDAFGQAGLKPRIAVASSNIGTTYYDQGLYADAIAALNNSIELFEELRRTAKDEIRRDYLASRIPTYRYLTSAYLRADSLHQAFETVEQSHARLLAEQLAGNDSTIVLSSLDDVQQSLDEDTAVLIYANAGTGFPMTQLVLTREGLHGVEVSDSAFVRSALERYQIEIDTLVEDVHLLQVLEDKDQSRSLADPSNDFESLIRFYRTFLTNPTALPTRLDTTRSEPVGQPRVANAGEKLHDLSRRFHDLLIQPLDSLLTRKTRLLIVPDGVLGFLPFETLLDSTDQYLAQKYDIRYNQSLSVLDLIQERTYDDDRKPLLAFGGAVYDSSTYDADMASSAAQLEALQEHAYGRAQRNENLREDYARLGRGTWTNLPGTLDEVAALTGIIDGVEVITGAQVNESRVKRLSDQDTLAQYRVLHFATHAFAEADAPELSALVLSQVEGQDEDGYLRMGEVAELKLEADFVNLSACETGLGRLYGGEGVVGLAQAFMLAGANALSVSLWRVADRSTSVFMQEVYRLVAGEQLGYAEALTQVKREFLSGEYGEAYRAPYYWAPFVYYGE